MELVDLFQGALGCGGSGERFRHTLTSYLSMQTQLWMARAIRLSAMAMFLATAPDKGSHTAWAEIAQSKKLAQQVGALGLQIRDGQSHEGPPSLSIHIHSD